jgi:hypothetical protein
VDSSEAEEWDPSTHPAWEEIVEDPEGWIIGALIRREEDPNIVAAAATLALAWQLARAGLTDEEAADKALEFTDGPLDISYSDGVLKIERSDG